MQEDSSQFNERNYLKTRGAAMGPKMAGVFATIFMAKMQILDKGARLETLHGRHNLSLEHKQIRHQSVL